MFSIKDYIYVGIIISLIGASWYILRDWHYKPLDVMAQTIITLKQENQQKEITINNLSVQIVELMENNKVTGFEEYFKGVSDANNTIITDKLIF